MGKWFKSAEEERGETMRNAKEDQKYIRFLEWAVFAGVLLVLNFFLWRYTLYTVDSDAASELVLAKHLADSGGGLLSKNWYYSTELKVLCDQLAFELMFFLTDNWHLVRMGGTLILLGLLVLSVYYFCRETGCRRNFPLLAALILLPLSRTYFNIVFKFTYYIPYIVTGFAVIAAEIQFATGEGRKKYLALILAALLSLAAGLLGFRLLLNLYIPLVLAVLMYLWLNKGASLKKKLLLAGTGTVTGAALIGCVINQTILARQYCFQDFTQLSFAGFSFRGVENFLGGLLEILGYRAGAPVFSQALFPTALSGILLLLCFYCAGYIACHRDQFNAAQQIAAYYYLAVVLVFCLLYCLTNMQYTNYHSIQAAIQGLPLIFICFGKREIFGKAGRGILWGLTCLALLCGALQYNDMRKEDKTRALREAVQFLTENDYREGYASFWNGNVTTELSNGALEMWVWDEHKLAELEDPDEIGPWLQSKTHDSPPAGGKIFILLTANEAYYCEFAHNFTEDDIIFKTANYEPGAIDEYIIYGFDSYAEMRSQFYGQN